MAEINKSREVEAPIDTVWKLLADLDNEHRNWSMLRDVRILGKTENSVEREVKIRRGPMGEAKSVQTLTIDPVKKCTTLKLTEGPMLGTRRISVSELRQGLTKIEVNWEFKMKGVPGFAMGFVTDSIMDVTEKALAQIAEAAEQSSAIPFRN